MKAPPKLANTIYETKYRQNPTRQRLFSWGSMLQMPIGIPFFVIHCSWSKEEYYIHRCQAMSTFEIILDGSMKYTLQDSTYIVKAGEMTLLPLGWANKVEVGPDEFCRKTVIGFSGMMSEILLTSFGFYGEKVYSIPDPGRILRELRHLIPIYEQQDESLLNSVSAKAFEILLELKEQAFSSEFDKDTDVSRIIQLMQANLRKNLSIREFAHMTGISRNRLTNIFKQNFNMSPRQYLTLLRMQMAKQHLLNSKKPIKEIAWLTGYNSLSRFITAFRKQYGQSPREFRNSP